MAWQPAAGSWAGGGGAALIHQPNLDAGLFCLVAQGLNQVSAAPLPQPEVVDPTGILGGDAGGVADHQHADSMRDREGDDLVGRLVVGLVDAAAVTCLDSAQSEPISPPAARASLPGLGRPPGCPGLSSLLIMQVQEALGPDRPPRHQQARLVGDHRVGVDDAKIHPCHPMGVQVVVLNGHGGGDGQPELSTIGHQGDRTDLAGRIGDGRRDPIAVCGQASAEPDNPWVSMGLNWSTPRVD